jgi:lysophospholipase L1-like esterase
MGARIVFVESPTWGGPVAPQVLAACDSVARSMDVPFLRIVPEHYPELARAELYKDRVHLNRAGAEKFTALLAPMLAEELRRR